MNIQLKLVLSTALLAMPVLAAAQQRPLARKTRFALLPYYGTLSVGADRTMLRNVVGRIEITGDDLTLDCDGHTITATASGSCGSRNDDCGIIVDGRSNVTLIDCEVIGHGVGIWIGDSENIDVERSRAEGNGVGYRIDDSHNVAISFSTATVNDEEGFVVRDSTYSFMWENTSHANGRDGFDENGGAHAYYLRNVSINNAINGFELDFHEDADFSENEAWTNGQHGISLDAVDGGLMHDNFILGNGEDGLRLDEESPGGGQPEEGTVDFEVSDNYSAANGDDAAHQCANLCTGNVFINNQFYGPTNNIP